MAGAPEALMRQLSSRAALAENLILELRRQVEQLTMNLALNSGSGKVTTICSQISAVRSENEALKVEINLWKDKLTLAEEAKGIIGHVTTPAAPGAQLQAPPPALKVKPNASSEDNIGKKAKTKAKDTMASNKATKEVGNNSGEGEASDIDVGRLDMRVGIIRTAKRHPDADALYVEEVDLGEDKPRTVISGLVKFIPEDQMQNRKAILLCNLKPAKMRGILSEAMVMCASTPDKVEILSPPESSKPGDLVMVEGYARRPDPQLNPKKKIFESCAPDLKVNDLGVATYKGVPWTVNGEQCKSQTLINVQIK